MLTTELYIRRRMIFKTEEEKEVLVAPEDASDSALLC